MNEQVDLEVLAERLNQLEKRVYDRFASEEKVRDGTKLALDAKLEGMNELRTQINRERGAYVTWSGLFTVSMAMAMFAVAVATLIQRMLK